MLGLRHKLALGFGVLLIILLAIGIQSIVYLSKLGDSIDVILRENYRSVIACQQMKEALERIDSGILFTLLGDTAEGQELILKNEGVFEKALQVELNNITVPGEGEKADFLRTLYERYKVALPGVQDPTRDQAVRRDAYFTVLFPTFGEIKSTADQILQMNQKNMSDSNDRARELAARVRQQMYFFLITGVLVALLFIVLTGRWILRPIQRLIGSAEEIRRGNLDIVVTPDSEDEIGRLAESFNAMTASLREFRRSDQSRLLRVQKATQEAFDRLPDAVAVLDLEGRVEVSTESAKTIFGLRPGATADEIPPDLKMLFEQALAAGRPVPPRGQQRPIQEFSGGQERFYLPEAVPILDQEKQPTGVILVLQDVTRLRQQDELKTDVIRAVSHQLKTPLTSVRMAIHLLLEDQIGCLTDKQTELLVAAREDSDRLHEILANLLDVSRLEAGKPELEFQAISPQMLVMDAIEPYRRTAQDHGVLLAIELRGSIPNVWVDRSRAAHIFGNLLTNALDHTPRDGKITVTAQEEEDVVRFTIADTGAGIPTAFLSKIFEPFVRVPEEGREGGAGLGLAIVKDIVESHGGTVSVESREGEGTTVTFTLRRADRIDRKEKPA